METKCSRNDCVDVLRGIAILLVVLGHTMTGTTLHSENTFLFNIIWTLQMPLFFLISGYVNRYSKKLETGRTLFQFIKRRSVSYLLPWLIWTFIVRGLILCEVGFWDIKHLLWHMDSGYWFLISLWTITIVYGIASFLAITITKRNTLNDIGEIICFTILYTIGVVLLLWLGRVFGLAFMAIKFTLYYMPFYYCGVMFGKYQNALLAITSWNTIEEIIIALCLSLWIGLMVRINVFYLDDNGIWIFLRAITSIAGCISVIGLLPRVHQFSRYKYIRLGCVWLGVHSLEIYLCHYIFLSPIKLAVKFEAVSVQGILITMMNFLITEFITVTVVTITSQNSVLRKLLYGKNVFL